MRQLLCLGLNLRPVGHPGHCSTLRAPPGCPGLCHTLRQRRRVRGHRTADRCAAPLRAWEEAWAFWGREGGRVRQADGACALEMAGQGC